MGAFPCLAVPARSSESRSTCSGPFWNHPLAGRGLSTRSRPRSVSCRGTRARVPLGKGCPVWSPCVQLVCCPRAVLCNLCAVGYLARGRVRARAMVAERRQMHQVLDVGDAAADCSSSPAALPDATPQALDRRRSLAKGTKIVVVDPSTHAAADAAAATAAFGGWLRRGPPAMFCVNDDEAALLTCLRRRLLLCFEVRRAL